MEYITEVHAYLVERIKSGKTDGIKLIKSNPHFSMNATAYIELATNIMQQYMEYINDEWKAKLTPVSIEIGNKIMLEYPDDHNDVDHVKVGDVVIEAFFQKGYIDIPAVERYSSSPVYIIPTEKWMHEIQGQTQRVIRGIYSEAPGKLPFIQKVQFKDETVWSVPTVKRWGDEDKVIFDTVVRHSAAHKSIEKLANVGWRINRYVYDRIKDTVTTEKNKSKILEHQYTLQYAAMLADEDKFYFAPEFDYRGRVYFTMPYLNFQGADLARGLLTFSDRKYVSEAGHRWMKIHAACSFNQSYEKDKIPDWCTEDYRAHLDSEGLESISVDKMTLRDRELWVDNNWQVIEASVEGMDFDCEKPYSFMAVAKELYDYAKSDMYFSSLPIPVDGSNNGWQHLGAISKDTLTGGLVGLVPVEIQADFYVQTAKALAEITTDERRQDILLSMPMKHIRKGISKRGSMTRAYSAGAQKIAENMYQDCKKEGFTWKYDITEKDCKGFARDLVKAIEMVCPGPLKTMKYLQNLAGSCLEEGEDKLTWVSPSGFPVQYESYHTRMPTIRSTIKGYNENTNHQVGHKIMLVSDAPDRRGFMCGISPNFIHSQDAAHMHLTINKFEGDFGAVHDSFSTHANEVDDLLEITKDTFIEMYSHPNYFNRIQQRIGGEAEQPELGELNIEQIKESNYFFA